MILFRYYHNLQPYVIKFYSLQHLDESEKESAFQDVWQEFMICRTLSVHPGSVKVFECTKITKESELIGAIISMEFFPMTLHQYMRKKGVFESQDVIEFLHFMDRSLEYLHYNNRMPVVHADIKPANIGIRFINNQIEYVLMDFDITVKLNQSRSLQDNSISNKAPLRGLTPQYAAPEQVAASINRTGNISNRVDIYAVGVIAIQMLTGIAPFKKENELFYRLPLSKIHDPFLRQRLNMLVDPDPRRRVKKISKIFGSLKYNPRFTFLSGSGFTVSKILLGLLLTLTGVIILLIIISSIPKRIHENKNTNDSIQPASQYNTQKPNTSPLITIMPNVVGLPLNDAKKYLEYMGLQLGRVEYIPYRVEYQGMVLYATYRPYDYVLKNSYVDLVIGK
jgi:serine/threonine protein kinase